MSEHLLDDLEVRPAGKQKRGRAVPEIMKPDRGLIGFAGQALEQSRHVGRVQSLPVLSGEHPPGLDPRRPPGVAFGGLSLSPLAQRRYRVCVERDRANTVGLGWGLVDLPAELDDLPGYVQFGLVEVDV
jgi:hypothetical protein